MKRIFSIGLVLLAILTCAQRQNPVYPRNNPWDSESENFSKNSLPSISGFLDSLWYDYDHAVGSGSIRLHYATSDPNLSNDTLTTRIFIIDNAGIKREIAVESESTCIVAGLIRASTYRCSLEVRDTWDSSGTFVDTIKTPALIPPFAPRPSISNSSKAITIKWKTVDGATGYSIYRAGNRKGPYELLSVVPQQSSAACSVMYSFDKPVYFYFIVASKNLSGECRSRDTLRGIIFSDKVPVPVIDSVSKGTYPDFINISWHINGSAVSGYELYRSASGDTSSFSIIAAVQALTGVNSYNDSVTDSEIYYYKIAAVDTQGYSSRLSTAEYGFLKRPMLSTRLSIVSSARYIGLYWDPVSGASSYAVYRSATSCTAAKEKIATTASLSYNDSVLSTATFYYSVVGLDKEGREVGNSNCEAASLGRLPAPSGIIVTSSKNPAFIKLSWDPLTGADSFIVFRATGVCPASGNQYATTKNMHFIDTAVSASVIYNYRVAAVDRGGRPGTMSNCYTGSIKLLNSPVGLVVSNGLYPDYILLKWNALPGAVRYNIYRSNSCRDNNVILRSVTDTTYIDSVPTTDIYYYIIAGVDNEGMVGSPSACTEGRVKLLPAPSNFNASNGTYSRGIALRWDPVAGATGYILYRGTTSATNSAVIIDTVASPGYFDSVTTTSILYYWVAALNRLGPGARSNYAYGSILTPPTLFLASRSTAGLTLSWKSNGSALKSYICRSKDSSNLIRYDSTTATTYTDYPPDFEGYYYRVDLRMPSGEIVASNIVLGYKLLSPPEGLKATDALSGVLLQWKRAAGATAYKIYHSESPSGSTVYKEVTDTFYFDNLNTTTRYYYSVAAANSVQTSAMSPYVVGGTLLAPDPPVIQSVTGTANAIIVVWTMPSGSSTPAGYYISRTRSPADPVMIIDSTTLSQYADTVNDSGYYYYRIAAYNARGISAWSTAMGGRLIPPPPPVMSSISLAYYSAHVRLVWGAVSSASHYSVYRSTSQALSTFIKIGSTTDTIFFDTSAVPNTRYYYRLTTTRFAIEGDKSNPNSGMRLGPPASVYAEPAVNGILVQWPASTNLYSVRMYYIYRATSPTGAFAKIDSVSGRSGTNSYLDTNDVSGANYYKISASNLDESPLSVSSEAVHRLFPDAPYYINASEGTDSAAVMVSWNQSYGAQGYRIYRCMSDSFLTGVVLIGTSSTAAFIDSVPSDSFYYYKVKSFNKAGESSLSLLWARGFRIPRTVPHSPSSLDTIDYGESVVLSWTMPSRTVAYTGFRIYRSESADGTYTQLSGSYEINDGIYYYYDRPPNTFPTVYWYRITAYNSKGESAPSNIVSATRR